MPAFDHPCSASLFRVLASSYGLYLKTQNYHWNVQGPLFRPLHLLFEEQYEALGRRIDVVAELIRTLGDKVEGTFTAFAAASCVGPGRSDLSGCAMAADLAQDHRKAVGIVGEALVAARKQGHEGVITLLTDNWLLHEKAAWMLESTAQDTQDLQDR